MNSPDEHHLARSATCPMCAEDVAADATVCPHCGHALGVAPMFYPGMPGPPPYNPPTIEPARITRRQILIIAAVTSPLVLASVGLWAFLHGTFGGGSWCVGPDRTMAGECFPERVTCEARAALMFDASEPGSGRGCAWQRRVWCVAEPGGEVVQSPGEASCYSSAAICREPPRFVYGHGEDEAVGEGAAPRACVEVTGRVPTAAPQARESAAPASTAAAEVLGRPAPLPAVPTEVRPATPPPRAAETSVPVAPAARGEPLLEVLAPSRFSASSAIRGGHGRHAPERAFDGDRSTAWNEAEPGPGDGAWIEATFARPVRIQRVTLSTGWDSASPRHGDLFPLNSHLRRVRITFDGGRAIERGVGAAERILVVGGLSEHAETVRIEAMDVWPGTRWADLCISDILIEGTPLPTNGSRPAGTRHHPHAAAATRTPAARQW